MRGPLWGEEPLPLQCGGDGGGLHCEPRWAACGLQAVGWICLSCMVIMLLNIIYIYFSYSPVIILHAEISSYIEEKV